VPDRPYRRLVSTLRTFAGDRRADVVVTAALLVIGESQVILGWHAGGVGVVPDGTRVARAVLCALIVLPLALRRDRPLVVTGVVCGAVAAQVLLVVPYVPFLAGLLPVAIANYSVAAYARRWRAAGLVLGFLLVAVLYARITEERAGGEVLFALFVILGTWLAGDVVRGRVERAVAAVAEARRAVVEQQAAHDEALAAERARIARELHDVIAHSVSLMGVQAGAARTLMDVDDDAARAALLAVEDAARTSVGELHRLLTVLRARPEDTPGRDPQPGLQDVTSLVNRTREAGLPIDLRRAPVPEVPAGVGLAAYRIVQEALTNSLKHAGRPTLVRIEVDGEALAIEVRNASLPGMPGASHGGHGLVGMRERAHLYGGTLEAGRDESGDFVVLARLPLEASRSWATA
jgi:signal transduction histidine kinase